MTLNLTGHILLAIGIATSLLAYMFLNQMSNEGSYGGSSSGSGYENRYGNYRSDRIINKVLILEVSSIFKIHVDESYNKQQ